MNNCEQQLLNIKYRGRKCAKYHKDLERLKRGEPLDYIIGWTEFLGCKIDLSQKPLVPRNETEFWVKKVINQLKNQQKVNQSKLKILDIFSGSGCIGIALLKHLPKSTVGFADSEENCLRQIKINLKLNNINSNRCEILKSDIFSNITEKYDYIFANPPYISANSPDIQKEVLKYEPQTAVLAGKDGLKYIIPFLQTAKKHLIKEGRLFMECVPVQKEHIEQILKRSGYLKWKFHRDQYGKIRYLQAL